MNPQKQCRLCTSTTNGYYGHSRTCRKCVNKKLHISKTKKAREEGYNSVYHKQKEKVIDEGYESVYQKQKEQLFKQMIT